MKNRSVITLIGAALALVAAGVAWAQPDLAAAVVGFLSSPDALVLTAFGPLVRSLQAQDVSAATAMRALVDAAEAENRDLTEAEATTFAQHKANRVALKARIERAQQMELDEAGLAASTAAINSAGPVAGIDQLGRSIVALASGSINVSDNIQNDPGRGFHNIGEFARAVHGAWRSNKTGVGGMDSRLVHLLDGRGPQAAAPSTYTGEGSGADGGFLIPPGFSSNVFSLSLLEDSLLPYTDQMPIDGNSMLIPKDEATPWGTNGPRAYWQSEAGAGTPTKSAISMMDLRLKKLLALTPVSDELLADTSALNAYLPKRMALSVRWKTNEAIMFGSGNGTPLGAFTGAAGVVQAKDSGQSTLTLTTANLLNMFSRLPPGSYGSAVWQINNTVIPALGGLTLGNYPIFLPMDCGPTGAANGGPLQQGIQWTLLGRPVLITQHAKAFSSQGDVILTDLSYYQTITKAEGIQTATSMHLYFDADAMAFRVTFRVDGQPKIAAPISPANGSTTLSPFVQLQAR